MAVAEMDKPKEKKRPKAQQPATRRRAPKAKKPDVDQKRFVDPETNEEINAPYRNKAIDETFSSLRSAEMKLEALAEKRKQLRDDLRDILEAEESEIETKNDGNPYVAIDPAGEPWYVGLQRSGPKLSIKHAKLKAYDE